MSINSSFLHATHIVHHLEMEYNYFKDKYLYENIYICNTIVQGFKGGI